MVVSISCGMATIGSLSAELRGSSPERNTLAHTKRWPLVRNKELQAA